MTSSQSRFYGKYRGTVSDTSDPLQTGRIKARIPDVMDDESGWAMPCAPVAGSGMGVFALPPNGAGVWIEFEHGDPDYPVWSGCWWGSAADVPTDVAAPPQTGKILLQTDGGTTILLDDTPGAGGITLKTPGGQKIVISSTSIEIDNGSGASLKLSASQVSINNGALEVM
ncbi:phage baseplate assembly protein V [Microbacterium sp. NPDC019599]|uniref:phage baseplate assembly protein V n=1 Tax=Microbacterium sp. NPDC019599 TaxID=3154690 RepID=UPI0033CB98B5